MSQKLLFIFNPHAGKGQIKNHLVDIVDMMVKAGFDVTIYTTHFRSALQRLLSTRTGMPSCEERAEKFVLGVRLRLRAGKGDPPWYRRS